MSVNKRIKMFLAYFGLIRTAIPMLAIAVDLNMRKEVFEDLEANREICLYNNPQSYAWLNYMLLRNLPYRSVYRYRLRKHRHYVIFMLSKIVLHDKLSIEIGGR